MQSKSMTVCEIERLIDAGVDASALEPLIDSLAIEPDEKAALWLRAWCEGQRRPEGNAFRLGQPA
jgi:hypothetical protein